MTKGCLERVTEAGAFGACSGVIFGAIGGAWAAPPVSEGKGFAAARSLSSEFPQVVKLMGRHTAAFGFVAATFAAGDCISESVRHKVDPLNGFVGGALAGALLGIQTKRLDIMCGTALGLGIATAVLDLNGPKIVHDKERMKQKHWGLRMAPPPTSPS